MSDTGGRLEEIYAEYTRRVFVTPDPLETLYDYPDVRDREIVALLAAALAYGQVKSIVGSLRRLLPRLGRSPADFLEGATPRDLARATAGLGHRWTRPRHLTGLLRAMQAMRRAAGNLEAGLARHLAPGTSTVEDALARWTDDLRAGAGGVDIGHLVADPRRGSSCKRLHLFLRWMVRQDAVDPGGWTALRPAQLLVPVDVHMHRIGRALRFTRRSQPGGRAVQEITAGFRRYCPEDPVRYDFALTRLGIRERLTGSTAALRRRLAGGRGRSADKVIQAAGGG